MTVLLYLLLGAIFAIAASLSFNRGGAKLLALTTLLAAVLLLAVGLWQHSTIPHNETGIGLPILLALVPPTAAAVVIRGTGRRNSSLRVQWIKGMLVWAGGFVAAGLAALLLDWVTF